MSGDIDLQMTKNYHKHNKKSPIHHATFWLRSKIFFDSFFGKKLENIFFGFFVKISVSETSHLFTLVGTLLIGPWLFEGIKGQWLVGAQTRCYAKNFALGFGAAKVCKVMSYPIFMQKYLILESLFPSNSWTALSQFLRIWHEHSQSGPAVKTAQW